MSIPFEPAIFLRTPLELLKACGPDPKVIEWDTWLRLEQAGLSLTQADLPRLAELPEGYHAEATYPLKLVRALAAVWLFGGLRRDEIGRLPIGCTRCLTTLPQSPPPAAGPAPGIVSLRVPANKSGGPFDKAVDARLDSELKAWERCQRARSSPQAQQPELLFVWQGRPLRVNYINQVLIPLLCRKAGLSNYDAQGRLTCHRARATLATYLYKRGVPLRHIQQWLGHNSPHSLIYYIKTDKASMSNQIGEALQAKQIWQSSLHLSAPTLVTRLPAPMEPVAAPAPQAPVAASGSLAHLRVNARKTRRATALTIRSGIAQIKEQVLLSAADHHAMEHVMQLLSTIAIQL